MRFTGGELSAVPVCPRNFACNSPVATSTFEVKMLKSCGFQRVVVCGRQGITCGIGECGDGGAVLAAGCRTFAAVGLVLQGVVGGELRAELVIVRVVPIRSPRLYL